MKHASAASSLNNYRTIWERNIFGTLGRENPDSQKNAPPEPLPPVSKNSELKLMGTVLASDSAMSRAIIYDRSTRKQNIYHEGDRAGKAQIKKILRNSVIIDTGQGEETLAMKIEKSKRGPPRFPTSPRIPGTVRPTSPRRPARYRLEQAEIDSQIGDPDEFVEQLRVTPYTRKGEPQGLRISGISASNPLRRLGFRNGDVIQQVNDETVTSDDQAVAMMQQFKSGGDFTVQVLRRGRPRELQLQIE
jgi:type II secretion system protein C